jgi:branched-chain amino acid aminotransferase
MLPTNVAKKEGFDQIIWTDGREHRYMEESGTTNLFFVIDDELVLTPELDGNILEGVTRDSCITLLKDAGYHVEERRISISEIASAMEKGHLTDAFGTGTAAIIAKISSITDHGNEYVLPDPDKRKVSNWLYKHIYRIQTGQAEDKYNWIYKL